MYAFGAMLSFTIAHLSVIRLRQTQPDFERPYRGPGNLRIAGRTLPLFAVLGGIGTGLAFVTVTACIPTSAIAGTAGSRSGSSSTSLYRRRQRLDLVTTVKVAIPRPVVDHEAEYDSVLVVFDETRLRARRSWRRRAAGRAAAAGHPRARADHRALELADRRRARPSRSCGRSRDRGGEGPSAGAA